MDGALAIARMIVRGVFEKFPNLKVVGTHLGGGICEMIGRMDYAYTLGTRPIFLGCYEPMLIKHEPSHYLKMMYLESTSYQVPGARCALESVGADHFIFGTDAPPLFVAQGGGRRADQEDRAFAGGRAQSLLRERQEVVEDLTRAERPPKNVHSTIRDERKPPCDVLP